jgi:hypothetical protein
MSDGVQVVFYGGLFAVILAVIPIIAAWAIRQGARTDARLAREDAKVAQADARAAAEAAKVAVKEVKIVKDTLAKDTVLVNEDRAVVHEKLDKIHVLVNNKMQVALDRIARLAKRVASQPDATEQDKTDLREAEADLEDHKKQQAIVDADAKENRT